MFTYIYIYYISIYIYIYIYVCIYIHIYIYGSVSFVVRPKWAPQKTATQTFKFAVHVQRSMPGKFGFSVSHATRKPRPGEQDGVSYHFVTVPGMEAAIANDEFIEYAAGE